jgi:cytochrome c553
MSRVLYLFAVLSLLAAGGPAAAQDDTLARNLVATCANCHGTNGHALKGSGMEALAGADAAKMLQKLHEFKSGVRPATVMQQIVKGYTDEEIELIAGYLARQK